MIITTRLIRFWFVLFLPFCIVYLFLKYQTLGREFNKTTVLRSDYIGTKFKIDKFIDWSQNPVTLNVSNSDFTIIDFWHIQCAPCIQEMKQFKDLIKGEDKLVSIVSVSINDYAVWSQLFRDNKTFSFLNDSVPNWRHLLLKANRESRSKMGIPPENLKLLIDEYRTNSFPAYLVLDRSGTIIATPPSAVDYIKTDVLKQNVLSLFFTNDVFWSLVPAWIPGIFVEYSGYFWIVAVIVLWFSRKRRDA